MGEGADGKSVLEMRDTWQSLVDILQQSCDISCLSCLPVKVVIKLACLVLVGLSVS